MMPYAANGQIAKNKFYGAIQITEEQYVEALDGMCNGAAVTIDGGFKVELPASAEPEPAPEPTPEELAGEALARRDQLLRVAAIRIDPLQDAIDLDDATDADVTALRLWKEYRVALNRLDQQAGFPQFINWPSAPGEAIA